MKKIITYGTFDFFHQGHYNILKRAKDLGDYLIVGVTSESYDIERGKLSVHDSLLTRIENVKKTGLVDEIIVEEYLGQKVRDIIKYDVDTLVVGSDWIGKFDHLKKYCNVVYLERTKNISSTQIREEKNNSICTFGIVTDDINDNDVVKEVRYVSGLHVESVFSEDEKIAKKFAEIYELHSYTSDIEEFYSNIGMVYIKTELDKRYEYIKKALEKGVNVICDFPFTLDREKENELYDLANKNKVMLIENIVMVYLRAFTQIAWNAQGNVIGNIVSVNASISRDICQGDKDFNRLSVLPICAVLKILGTDYKKVTKQKITNEKGKTVFGDIRFEYENAVANIDIGVRTNLENKLTIIGEEGSIVIQDDWWNTGYFEIHYNKKRTVERHSFNFEGTGFRYILQELMIMISDNRYECNRLFTDEAKAIVDVLQDN